MKRFLSIIALLLIASPATADYPLPATAPANPLIGRWQFVSMGRKTSPEGVQIFWTFDERNVVVTAGNGDVATTSQYTLGEDGVHHVISLVENGTTEPNRIGWYQLKEGRLRLQLTVGTGKPPEQWDEDQIMVFERAAVD